jgi:putative PIN family toxin of toxin-antitoxin system
MRVFLDTNVIVSAVATRGLCADVMREILVRHQLVISEDLLKEVTTVLRAKLGVPGQMVSDFVALLKDSAVLSDSSPTLALPISGAVDGALVSAALNGQADLFVTGDREILAHTRVGPLDIVSPRMFWERTKGLPEK